MQSPALKGLNEYKIETNKSARLRMVVNPTMKSQTTVAAHLKSKQLLHLLVYFARQNT